MRYIGCRGAVQTSSPVARNSERRVTGGGSQIKESPEVSPPVHISAGGRGTRRSEREKRQRRTSRICSWQLFQQPVFHWLLFCSPVTFFFLLF